MSTSSYCFSDLLRILANNFRLIPHNEPDFISALEPPQVLVITGPTATGKTALAVQLAAATDGEIVSADSMQVYKHMDIGTAKPTTTQMQGIRHHMIDVVLPFESYSVARYVKDASACADDILMRGKVPILVGGTGLYIDSLLSGRDFSPRDCSSYRDELSNEYDLLGGMAMLEKLRDVDPETADRLHSNDKKRILRALEVYELSGKTISAHNYESQKVPPRYNTVKFILSCPDREVLYKKIDDRVDSMLVQGLEDEVRALLDMGVPPNATAMQAIGYKELVPVIQEGRNLAEAIVAIKTESRRYAKRQLTWLRRSEEHYVLEHM